VTAKTITAKDRDVLARNSGNVVRIFERSGFDKSRFVTEVRCVLVGQSK
jgi:hypothetical protein